MGCSQRRYCPPQGHHRAVSCPLYYTSYKLMTFAPSTQTDIFKKCTDDMTQLLPLFNTTQHTAQRTPNQQTCNSRQRLPQHYTQQVNTQQHTTTPYRPHTPNPLTPTQKDPFSPTGISDPQNPRRDPRRSRHNSLLQQFKIPKIHAQPKCTGQSPRHKAYNKI